MNWYSDLSEVLSEEPENWLAYLYGQKISHLLLVSAKVPRYRGFILQLAKFGVLLLRGLSLKESRELEDGGKFFVFAGTENQMSALNPTISALRQKGEKVVAVTSSRSLADSENSNGYLTVNRRLDDVVQTLILFLMRGFSLYQMLKSNHPVSVKWHYANFCSVYIYLTYFYRVLSQMKPEFVVTSNDHSIPNRCMLAVAHQIGIKTVYLQHASVSSIFPALRVTYAFLDGQCALDTYRKCEPNQPDTLRKAPVPDVILAGQQKDLKKTIGIVKTNEVGVAVNDFDDIHASIDFINALTHEGLYVRLRWHPSHSPINVKIYRETFMDNGLVVLSDPRIEPISNFLNKISCLIAGNSSIHLEAALAKIVPIYFELTPTELPDYYGYLRNGICIRADTTSEVLNLLKNKLDKITIDDDAVKYYSSTFNTEWEGKEGNLVAECLRNLSIAKELPVNILKFH